MYLLFILSIPLLAQEHYNKGEILKGNPNKVYTAAFEVYQQRSDWDFKKSEFAGGDIHYYDEKGRVRQKYLMAFPTSYIFSKTFEYDKDGNWEGLQNAMDRETVFKTSVQYDAQGRMIKSEEEVDNFHLDPYKIEFYYQKDDLIKVEVKDWNPFKWKFIYGDFKNGRPYSKITIDSSGQEILKGEYLRDEFGNEVLYQEYDLDGKITQKNTHQYLYDEKGNWIRTLRSTQKDGQQILIYRTIIYSSDLKENDSPSELYGTWVRMDGKYIYEFSRKGKLRTVDLEKGTRYLEGKWEYRKEGQQVYLKEDKWKTSTNLDLDLDKQTLIFSRGRHDFIPLIKLDKIKIPGLDRISFEALGHNEIKRESFEMNGKWGMKDANGKILIPAKYDQVFDFTKKVARVGMDGKFGLVNYTGKQISEIIYDDLQFHYFGLLKAKKDGSKGFLNYQGEMIVPIEFSNVWYVRNNNWILVENHDHKKGLRTKTGAVILPAEYKRIGDLKFNRMEVRKLGAVNWLDTKGEAIIPKNTFFKIKPINSNRFLMTDTTGQTGIMDSMGIVIKQPSFKRLEVLNWYLLAAAQEDGKSALVNTEGEILTPYKYDKIQVYNGEKVGLDLRIELTKHRAVAKFYIGYDFGYLDGFGKEIDVK